MTEQGREWRTQPDQAGPNRTQLDLLSILRLGSRGPGFKSRQPDHVVRAGYRVG